MSGHRVEGGETAFGAVTEDCRAPTHDATGARWAAWARAALAIVVRPGLWWVALRQLARTARPLWWRHPPFLPLPDRAYVRFRLETAYGEPIAPRPADVVSYLRWCRHSPD